jgi:hypothetical protein
MRPSLIVLALALFFTGTALSAPCARLELENVSSLTIQQVDQLTNRVAESNGGFSLVLWSFDAESYPRRGSLRAVAFMLVGMGDIDEQPVGALIWSSEELHLGLARVAETGIKIVSAGKDCDSSTIEITVQADGTVLAGGKFLGRVH